MPLFFYCCLNYVQIYEITFLKSLFQKKLIQLVDFKTIFSKFHPTARKYLISVLSHKNEYGRCIIFSNLQKSTYIHTHIHIHIKISYTNTSNKIATPNMRNTFILLCATYTRRGAAVISTYLTGICRRMQ